MNSRGESTDSFQTESLKMEHPKAGPKSFKDDGQRWHWDKTLRRAISFVVYLPSFPFFLVHNHGRLEERQCCYRRSTLLGKVSGRAMTYTVS